MKFRRVPWRSSSQNTVSSPSSVWPSVDCYSSSTTPTRPSLSSSVQWLPSSPDSPVCEQPPRPTAEPPWPPNPKAEPVLWLFLTTVAPSWVCPSVALVSSASPSSPFGLMQKAVPTFPQPLALAWVRPPLLSSHVWVVASTRRLLTSAPTWSVRSKQVFPKTTHATLV